MNWPDPIAVTAYYNFCWQTRKPGKAGSKRPTAAMMAKLCSAFTTWRQGYTPKEHVEMSLVEEQREWQRNRDRDDRRWRIIELAIMGIIVTLVSVAAQIIAAFIERGSLFPDQPSPPPAVPVSVESAD